MINILGITLVILRGAWGTQALLCKSSCGNPDNICIGIAKPKILSTPANMYVILDLF